LGCTRKRGKFKKSDQGGLDIQFNLCDNLMDSYNPLNKGAIKWVNLKSR
jgi:hypothetical protein